MQICRKHIILLISNILKLFQAVFMMVVRFFIEIIIAWPAALYQYDLCDPEYKDARKQLSRCAQWVAMTWNKLKCS